MCGIAGLVRLDGGPIRGLAVELARMNARQKHRGPDGEGVWTDPSDAAGLAHVRLAVVDTSAAAAQPMTRGGGNVVTYGGEIYNHVELRRELGEADFKTRSDTEVLLAAYAKWGESCVEKLRGMFAFAIWDSRERKLFCARDRFGVKPFVYATTGGHFAFASEAKALLPFLPRVETDLEGLKDYLAFQFTMNDKTLFAGVKQLEPAHVLTVRDGRVTTRRYWEARHDLDLASSPERFRDETRRRLAESVALHMRGDVPVGAYLSGGLDSSVVASLARLARPDEEFRAYVGRFVEPAGYDETPFARIAAEHARARLDVVDIGPDDFLRDIRGVIRHLDWPVAGPGSFPQFEVSRAAGRDVKVLLGGQGGDEVFGGYVRYLVAYFEACIQGAIDGTADRGRFVVTYESIIPNLSALRGYEPMLAHFWKEGLFGPRDRRYFRLVNRAEGLRDVIDWRLLEPYSAYETFRATFDDVGAESYFDRMTRFDMKTLLPALLHVEDRVSMAHGVESRVPLLDHELVEFVATAPAIVKFKDGRLKHLLREATDGVVPRAIVDRPDKMGFPVPLTQWARGPLREFVADTLGSARAQTRPYLRRGVDVDALIAGEAEYGRNLWALLSLELWQQEFHDAGGGGDAAAGRPGPP
jgi:asparagine synthase (glutamine-hydrolysing)